MITTGSHKSLTCADTLIYNMCPDISMTVLISSFLINKALAAQPILFRKLLNDINRNRYRPEIVENGVKTVMAFLDSESRKLSDASH
jgi:hypothetical protein